MHLKHANFTHDEDDLTKALGFTQDLKIRCRERIFFASILGYVLRIELYGKDLDDEIPKELCTITGSLQRCLSLITDQDEYEFTLFNFMNFHEMAMNAVVHYREKVNKNTDESEEGLKSQIVGLVRKMIEKKISEEGKSKDSLGVLSLDDMIDRIEKIKQSKQSFNRYMKLMGYQADDYTNVDDLLKQTLSKED